MNIKRDKCVDAIYCKKMESKSGSINPRILVFILVTGQKNTCERECFEAGEE